jgi:hypothetical protein
MTQVDDPSGGANSGAMGFFSQIADALGGNGDLSDPNAMAKQGFLAGLAHGFAQAAMPQRFKTPFGAVLGNVAYEGAQGQQQGALNALKLQLAQAQPALVGARTIAKNFGNQQSLQMVNILRASQGLPPLSMADVDVLGTSTSGGGISPAARAKLVKALQGRGAAPTFGSSVAPGPSTSAIAAPSSNLSDATAASTAGAPPIPQPTPAPFDPTRDMSRENFDHTVKASGKSADEVASILRARGLNVPDEWLGRTSMTPLERWLRRQTTPPAAAPRIALPQQAP